MTRHYLAASMPTQCEAGGTRYQRLVSLARHALPGHEVVDCRTFWQRAQRMQEAGELPRRLRGEPWWALLTHACDAFLFITAADGSVGEGVRQEHRVMHRAGHACFWLTEDGRLIPRGGYTFAPIRRGKRPDRAYTVTAVEEHAAARKPAKARSA